MTHPPGGFLKHIPAGDRIPLRQKLAFGAGASTAFLAFDLTIAVFWMPFFNIGLGLNPATLGIVLMVLQLWNALLEPVVGNLSDNARTRWGRRRPFIAVGAVVAAMLYLCLWRLPAGWGETATLAMLCLCGLSFFTAGSFWSMPFYAMQMELTPNYDERTRLMAWTALFGKGFGLLGGWSMAFVSCAWFLDPATGKPDLVQGMRFFSWVMAGLILVLGLLPAVVGRERYYEKEAAHQAKDPFWKSVRESASNNPLWLLIGVTFFMMLGSVSVGTLGQYVNIYFVNGGRIADASIITGWKSTALVTTGIACIPLWTWLGEKYDKRTIVAAMVMLTLVGHLLYIVCLRPDMPYLQIVPSVFEAGALSAIWIFLPSMKADVADYDEQQTCRRREGSVNAFFSVFTKLAITCALGVGGSVLQFTGFNAKLQQAQPPEVLHRMFLVFIIFPVVIWSLCLIFLWHYPLSRSRMAAIRHGLEERRGML